MLRAGSFFARLRVAHFESLVDPDSPHYGFLADFEYARNDAKP